MHYPLITIEIFTDARYLLEVLCKTLNRCSGITFVYIKLAFRHSKLYNMMSVSKLLSSDAARCQSHFTVWLLLIHICPELKFVSLSWSCLPASASAECRESTLSSTDQKWSVTKNLNMCFLCLRSFSSTSESDLFPWWFIDPRQSSPSRRTKSRISYREHTELVDESISPEGISTKTIPAVGEVLKLDLLLTVSCRCLNKNRYDTLLGCLEKIPGYTLT